MTKPYTQCLQITTVLFQISGQNQSNKSGIIDSTSHKKPLKGENVILWDAFSNTCSVGDGDGVHGSTRSLFKRCEGLIETHGIDRVPPGQRGSAISLESMQTDTSFVGKAWILAGHLIEAHLGAQLARSELLLGVVGPVFIERVAPQSSHRGPFGIALLFPPGIRPLPWVGGTLS